MLIGLVCDVCSALTPLAASSCHVCSAPFEPVAAVAPAAAEPVPVAAAASSEPLGATIDCPACGAEVPANFRFCGRCGSSLAGVAQTADPKEGDTARIGALPTSFARLILTRGGDAEDLSIPLTQPELLAGRTEGELCFSDDVLLSPRHATFVIRSGRLFVRDDGSVNGVFLRLQRPMTLQAGAVLLVGEQLLRLAAPPDQEGLEADDEETYYFASPKSAARIALVQVLAGGALGGIFWCRNATATLGREGCDVNFPDDPFVSTQHATVSRIDEGARQLFRLTDNGSRNGTYVRITGETELVHGDQLFLGQQVLRVEMVG